MFECEECGLMREDFEKNKVIDGIAIKLICNSCLDLSKHVLIKKQNQKEIDEKLLRSYNTRKILENISGMRKMDLREKLKDERIRRGLTIKQLSKLLEVTPEDLENFEKGLKEDIYIRKKVIDFLKDRI